VLLAVLRELPETNLQATAATRFQEEVYANVEVSVTDFRTSCMLQLQPNFSFAECAAVKRGQEIFVALPTSHFSFNSFLGMSTNP
jgi:hypothetical protein